MEMTPAMQRLVRLMILIPHESDHPIWQSMISDCADASEVLSMRWFVGDTQSMWPEAAPENLAAAVLRVFDTPSDATLRHLSVALVCDTADHPPGTGPGKAWVVEATATAVRVLADAPHPETVEQTVRDHWTVDKPTS